MHTSHVNLESFLSSRDLAYFNADKCISRGWNSPNCTEGKSVGKHITSRCLCLSIGLSLTASCTAQHPFLLTLVGQGME